VVPGKPTVRKAQVPGGNRVTEKRMPVAERQQETAGSVTGASAGWPAHNWPDTGWCPARKGADVGQVSL
jgi:hypothetical protein